MALPFAEPTTIINFKDFLVYTNYLVNGMLGVGILLFIGAVAYLTNKSYSYERAIGFSAFLTLISAILLRFLSLINDTVMFVCIALFVGSLIILFKERESEGV